MPPRRRPSPEQAGATAPPSGPGVVPRATYRLQLREGFGFAAATDLVPTLDRLGVSHLYLSPVLKARPGSAHGYDVVDPRALNPELGTLEAFDALVRALRERGMGLLLDIVPNHMGVFGADNPWWMDVLAHGRASSHARYFDIDWQGGETGGLVADAGPAQACRVPPSRRLLLPLLDDHRGVVLERGGLRLSLEAGAGAFVVWAGVHRLPLDPASIAPILASVARRLPTRAGDAAGAGVPPGTADASPVTRADTAAEAAMGAPDEGAVSSCASGVPGDMRGLRPRLIHLAEGFARLPPWHTEDAAAAAARLREAAVHQATLADMLRTRPDLTQALQARVDELNGRPGDPASFDALEALLAVQPWRAAHWLAAADEINYRRFFDINDLAALRAQDDAVFEATHGLIRTLVDAGAVDGLRVDHVDGLIDPAAYLARLASWTLPGTQPDARPYLVVEKVLAPQEALPAHWPVDGTTGYDFARLATGLCVDHAGRDRLGRCWRAFVDEEPARSFDETASQARLEAMVGRLAGAWAGLAASLRRMAAADRRRCDLTRGSLQRALGAFVAHLPVVRTYLGGQATQAFDPSGALAGPVFDGTDADRRAVEVALAAARPRCAATDLAALDFLRHVLLGTDDRAGAEASLGADGAARRAFVARLQPFTAAVMAKGVEDTAFYRHLRLLALNEVGGDPQGFGIRIAAFHRSCVERARCWPHTMLATSTHDTKRSEDVRARLAVLSEVPAAWRLAVRRWRRMNAPWRQRLPSGWAPSRHDEYLLYQTLAGTLPTECLVAPAGPPEDGVWSAWRARVAAYTRKAAREARLRTDWAAPDEAYETALQGFVDAALAWPRGRAFIDDLRATLGGFARCGAWNALAVTAWKFTVPGVPDLYQGQEGWDFSLVDPDNRRPIEPQALAAALQALAGPGVTPAGWGLEPLAGDAKRWLTWRLLGLRRRVPELFAHGGYRPLSIRGPRTTHALAYVRAWRGSVVLVATGRLFATLTGLGRRGEAGAGGRPLRPEDWRGTVLRTDGLPAGLRLHDALGGAAPRVVDGGPWPLAELFEDGPVAVWHGQA